MCVGSTKKCLEFGGYHGLVGFGTILFEHKNMCMRPTKRCLEIGGYHGLVGLATILFGHKNTLILDV
jgi:hypothetical protein